VTADRRREALELVHERLRARFGTPRPESRMPPLDEVVFTILSQNTTDTNRDRAWASLWRRFESWDEVASARVASIAAAIEVGGLHKVKARRIKDLLARVKKERGELSLDYLEDLDLEAAAAELAAFKGIGAKSVNCILLFSLGLPAFPVDTHVHRILRRLGVLETGDLGRANRDIQEHVPDEIAYPLHMNVIRHGREVCHARRPKCWSCNLEDLCVYEHKNLEER
jgi:endonuclease-3